MLTQSRAFRLRDIGCPRNPKRIAPTFEDVVVPGEGLVRGEVAVPVGEVEEAEGEREEDAGGGVDPGGAVRRALPRRLDLPLPTVALNVRNEVLLSSNYM